jgi:DNA-binding MarR family transcriptional regulator
MAAEEGESDEARSMRLLQPKLKILYYVWKKSGVKDNVSQISRDLGYKKDSWINDTIHTLLDEKYLDRQSRKDGEYFVLTQKGRRKIAPVAVLWVMPLMIVVIAFIPLSWGLNEMVDRTQVQPWIFLAGAIAIMGVGIFLIYEVRQLEKEYFSIVNPAP